MSLLLDALKKAAEQKAEKSRQEVPAARPSDETVVTTAAEDISALEAGAGSSLPQSQPVANDETELDASRLQTQLEQTRVARDAADETELEMPDPTQTPALSAQMQSGEDETIVFAEEDVEDFLGEAGLVKREPQDETDLSQLASAATDLSQTALQHDAPGPTGDAVRQDDTDISRPFQPGDQAETREPTGTGDDTDIRQHEPPADTTAPFAEPIPAEETDLSLSGKTGAGNAFTDADMSLLLVDRDDTNLTGGTSVTNPQAPPDIAQAIESDDGMDGLALVDTTQHQIADDITVTAAPTQTATSATTGITAATQRAQGATLSAESTSTRTYAPDNYDRTLMKLPGDDASKIFAGMKSDAGVVMTPDYAKKVFRSKSSAQRMQIYKIYGGLAVAILLSIGIFGAFEFQNQSNEIDSSLRPLKRDPMPGIIKPEDIAQEENLFAGSGANTRTIEIIESVDNDGEVGVADDVIVADEGIVADKEIIVDAAMVTEDVAITDSAAPAQAEPVETTQVASIDQATVIAAQSRSSSSTLEIISSSQIEQKDLWLNEAYKAYKSGDDSLAMTRYNQVLQLDPGNRNALLARAAIYVQNNNSSAAIEDYQALLLRNPKDSLAMTSLISVANYSPLETESQLKLMIRDEPDSPYLNFALANAYGAQNRWQEAQGYYFKALENNPQDPNYAYNLAVSLEHIAQPIAAVSYYQRALDNINHGLATFNREIVSQRMEILAK
jgi:Flp pilus assembly protein TadD